MTDDAYKKPATSKRPPSKKPPPPEYEYEAVPLDEIEDEVQEWLRDDFTPEAVLILLAGREGTGKGLWCCREVATITTGRSNLGEPVKVGVLTFEESLSKGLRHRMAAAGADRKRVFVLRRKRKGTLSSEGSFRLFLSLPQDLDTIKKFIIDNELRLLIIDPLMSIVGTRIKTGDEKQIRAILEPLAELAEETGCAVLGVMHFNKLLGADLLDRVMHSKAFTAVTSHVLGMGWDPTDPDGRRVAVVVAKSRVGPTRMAETFTIESHATGFKRRDGQEMTVGVLRHHGRIDNLDPNSILDRPKSEQGDTKVEQVIGALRDFFASTRAKDVIDEHGHEWREASSEDMRRYLSLAIPNGYSDDTLNRARKRLFMSADKQGKQWFARMAPDQLPNQKATPSKRPGQRPRP